MRAVLVGLIALAIVLVPFSMTLNARSQPSHSRACVMRSNPDRIYIGSGCKARVISVPFDMQVHWRSR